VGKPEGKRPLERPRSRWVENIKKDLREIEYGLRAFKNRVLGRIFSPMRTSVSPANLYSTNFFFTITITYHPGLVQ
jgi:hypothetical protein